MDSLLQEATSRFILKFSKYIGFIEYHTQSDFMERVRPKKERGVRQDRNGNEIRVGDPRTTNVVLDSKIFQLPSSKIKPREDQDPQALTIVFKLDKDDIIESIFDGTQPYI